jgi:hypothetical protein
MKRKKYIIAFLLVFLSFLGIRFLYFQLSEAEVKIGLLRTSSSMHHSQNLGVFDARYEPSIKKIDIKDIQINIIEAWSESLWAYTNANQTIEVHKNKTFCIRIKQEWLDFKKIKFSSPESPSIGFSNHQIRLDTNKDTINLDICYKKDSLRVLFIKKHSF